MKTTTTTKAMPVFIGIDYHKRYSVYCAVDERGEILARGRIEHARSQEFVEFVELVKR